MDTPRDSRVEAIQRQQTCKKKQAREPRGLTLEILGVQILHTDKPTLPTVFNETFEELRL